MWSTQFPLTQSLLLLQVVATAQPGHAPPQSTSVSSPFLTLSKQLVATQPILLHALPSAVQPLVLCWPSDTGAHVPLSNPVFACAQERQVPKQFGAQQMPSMQLPLKQSLGLPQALATAQPGHAPPQSTPVSSPFLT